MDCDKSIQTLTTTAVLHYILKLVFLLRDDQVSKQASLNILYVLSFVVVVGRDVVSGRWTRHEVVWRLVLIQKLLKLVIICILVVIVTNGMGRMK
jgi:hypothetical protein